jgi:RNA polymerase sigma-70 factor (ECF subfamily)
MTTSGSPPRMDAAARRAFEETVLPQLDRVFGMALRLTRSRAEAEDLTQDVMVRAYRFWGSFKPGTSVRSWLFTIVRNTFITRYHSNNRDRAASDALAAHHESAADDGACGPAPAHTLNPEQALGQLGMRERIDAALQHLPPDYRMAVALADIEGLSYKEIAEAMECPIGTVMSRIYRGRRQLHALLYPAAVDHGLAPATTTAAPVSLADYRKRGHA